MNDYYWNEYIKKDIDTELLVESLKLYQKSVTTKELYISDIDSNIYNLDTPNYSETFIEKIPVSDCDSEIRLLFNTLDHAYKEQTNILTFPILGITNESNLCNGIYSVDFKNKLLLMYKELDINNIDYIATQNKSIMISFFINIENAIAAFKAKGLLLGFKEVGSVCQYIKSLHNNYAEHFYPEQIHAHYLGLNVRKAFLACTLIGDLHDFRS